MKYKTKPIVIEIEAFQMTVERRMDTKDWPEWLHQAWNRNDKDINYLGRQNMAASLPDHLCVNTINGMKLLDWGDWIIQYPNKDIDICKQVFFDKIYEPIGEK